MLRTVCKAKITNARATELLVDYEGSLGLSSEIIKKAGLIEFEKVLVVNTANGNRFETYIIEKKEPGQVALYGGAAKLAKIGDSMIIMSYALIDERELGSFKGITLVKLKDSNRV